MENARGRGGVFSGVSLSPGPPKSADLAAEGHGWGWIEKQPVELFPLKMLADEVKRFPRASSSLHRPERRVGSKSR